ncbi:MAG: hypothetical protein QM804_17635 [Propionicimonas sp.]
MRKKIAGHQPVRQASSPVPSTGTTTTPSRPPPRWLSPSATTSNPGVRSPTVPCIQ